MFQTAGEAAGGRAVRTFRKLRPSAIGQNLMRMPAVGLMVWVAK